MVFYGSVSGALNVLRRQSKYLIESDELLIILFSGTALISIVAVI